uniref:Uncharacterized protein n=1 Tax=Arundo donax TaxID=35708 RepID=A0A0A9FB74_ARUDO
MPFRLVIFVLFFFCKNNSSLDLKTELNSTNLHS